MKQHRRTLLLNTTHEVLNFITEKRAIKLLFKGKAEIVSSWEDRFSFLGNIINFPAIMKMKYYVRRRLSKVIFSRRAVLRRDNYICAYCGVRINFNEATMDHIVPKSLGGENTFENCITTCQACNLKKGNKTPEQANMKLLYHPYRPTIHMEYLPEHIKWHKDWFEVFKVPCVM